MLYRETVGIDGSNISSGGGLNHLVELLAAASPEKHGFARVVLWSSAATLSRVASRPWLVKRHSPVLEKGITSRVLWQRFDLKREAREEGCDVIFSPGGTVVTAFRPVVTMSRNMLPFELRETARYGLTMMTAKLLLLRHAQTRSYRKADGVIFLTEYARRSVLGTTGSISGETRVIPHGVGEEFVIGETGESRETGGAFSFLYVSKVDVYKHQWRVAEAASRLRSRGHDIRLVLVGPSHASALEKLERVRRREDPREEFIEYVGEVEHAELQRFYRQADGFVFASSCENLPNILLEAMAAELPIACSDRGPMGEVLGDGGWYFDPENTESITRAMSEVMTNEKERRQRARAARERVQDHTWKRCAERTFGFLGEVLRFSRDKSR